MYQDKVENLRKQELQKIIFSEEDIPVFLSHCELISSIRWPMNLYWAIFDEQGIALKNGAEDALLSALNTLEPKQKTCILKLYKERMPWDSICDELDMYIVELDEHICRGLRKLRHPSNFKLLRQFAIYPSNERDNNSVAITDELKNAAMQLIKDSNVKKDEITLAFLQRNLKISFKRTLALKEYLDKTL